MSTFGHHERTAVRVFAAFEARRSDRCGSRFLVGYGAAPLNVWIRQRHGADQQTRVGVARLLDYLLDVADFSDRAAIQHVNVLADLVGGGQVMRDVHERNAHVPLESDQRFQDGRADRVLEAADRYGTMISVMSQRRWFPAAQRIREAIDSGRLGDRLVLGESVCEMWRDEAYYRRDAWRGRWDTEGGGVLMNQAPHNIDFLLWYMGPPVELFGYWANVNHPYVEIEDNAVAVIRFASGALGTLKATLSMNPERRIHGVSVVGGSGGTVSLDCWQVKETDQRVATGPWDVGSNDIWTVADGGPGPITHAEAVRLRAGDLPNYHAHQLREIIGAVREKRPPAVTGVDGRRVVAIIQGVYESTRTGRPVALS